MKLNKLLNTKGDALRRELLKTETSREDKQKSFKAINANNSVLDVSTGFISLNILVEMADSSLGTPNIYNKVGLKLDFESTDIYYIKQNNKIYDKFDIKIEVLHNTTIPNVYEKDYTIVEYKFDKIIKIICKGITRNMEIWACSAQNTCLFVSNANSISGIDYPTRTPKACNETFVVPSNNINIILNNDKTKVYWIVYEQLQS